LAAAEEELTGMREFVYLIDFGLARTAGEADLTAIGVPLGSVPGMPLFFTQLLTDTLAMANVSTCA
jgi:hypothetical protein